MKPRLLFVSEYVSFSHIGRPIALLSTLSPDEYEIYFAGKKECEPFLKAYPHVKFIEIESLSQTSFLRRLKTGEPLFGFFRLWKATQDDLQLLDELKPDAVISDLRWSMGIATEKRKIPCFSITNAHLSPRSGLKSFLCYHFVLSRLGRGALNLFFRLTRPIIFFSHSLPVNLVRILHGLRVANWNLLEVHCAGYRTLFADLPQMHPTCTTKDTESFVGPLVWQPTSVLPQWWDKLDPAKKTIYVNLGSSGETHLLPTILKALSDLPVQVIAATSGRNQSVNVPKNAFFSPVLPGGACFERADLAIYNGGSVGGYHALLSGTPMLAISSHFDQGMFMQAIEKANCGKQIAPNEVTEEKIKELVTQMLADETMNQAARRAQKACLAFDIGGAFSALLKRELNLGLPKRRRTASK